MLIEFPICADFSYALPSSHHQNHNILAGIPYEPLHAQNDLKQDFFGGVGKNVCPQPDDLKSHSFHQKRFQATYWRGAPKEGLPKKKMKTRRFFVE